MSRTLQRRQRLRLPVKLPAILSCVHGKSRGVITDLSMRGCALESGMRLDEGSVVRLKVPVPNERTAITVDYAAVRTVKDRRVGLEFLNISQEAKDRLGRLVFYMWKSHNDAWADIHGTGNPPVAVSSLPHEMNV
jgi:c-di-GMP-binding flagellar brake protein YcgR